MDHAVRSPWSVPRYQAELKQALAQQQADNHNNGNNGGGGRNGGGVGTGRKEEEEDVVAQLRAQVEHQDKQKRVLRQK